ncbi:MAG: hypothetical protein H6R07_2538 [Proteobacteria bacterium]|nr:hypothetical protein [Pseudomonadota bacterium]
MKALVAGVSRMKGIAKKSGNPYDMANVNTLTASQSAKTESFTKIGYGFEISQIQCTNDAVEQFAAFQGRFPLELELITDMTQFAGRLVPIVVGVVDPKRPA